MTPVDTLAARLTDEALDKVIWGVGTSNPAVVIREARRELLALLSPVEAACAQRVRALEAERDEYRTLAGVGKWHDDCRPNRHMAAREIAKGQEVINKLADEIAALRARVAALEQAGAAFVAEVRAKYPASGHIGAAFEAFTALLDAPRPTTTEEP